MKSKKMKSWFQFPSNGKAQSDWMTDILVCYRIGKFQFPSNGKAQSDWINTKGMKKAEVSFNSLQTGSHRQTDPIFDPLGPWLQNAKTKREVHKPFFLQKLPQKARKPTCPLTQTRFFNKNGSEVRHRLCSWAI